MRTSEWWGDVLTMTRYRVDEGGWGKEEGTEQRRVRTEPGGRNTLERVK